MLAILVVLTALLLSFGCTFAFCTLYIRWKRRPLHRYHYDKPAEPYAVRHQQDLETDLPTGVDGDSARWEK